MMSSWWFPNAQPGELCSRVSVCGLKGTGERTQVPLRPEAGLGFLTVQRHIPFEVG